MARIGPPIEAGHTGVVLDKDQIRGTNMDLMVDRALVQLNRHYDGWRWVVGADYPGLMLSITSRRLDTQWAYQIGVLRNHDDATDAWAKKAGGEYLERFGMLPLPFHKQRNRYKAAYRWGGRILPSIADSPEKQLREKIAIKQQVAEGKAVIFTDANVGAALAARR